MLLLEKIVYSNVRKVKKEAKGKIKIREKIKIYTQSCGRRRRLLGRYTHKHVRRRDCVRPSRLL